ncbi:MAG: DUF4869 domain-containing protein [bacterium]
MLNIFFGDMADVVYNTAVYFKFNYQPEWLQDPDVRQMILDVDSSVVLGSGAIDSPVLGVIAPVTLSGGVKTLILIDKMPDKVFNASNCGDNCAAWLLRIGRKKDVTVNLRHIMEFGDEPFEIKVLNTGEIIRSMEELVPVAGRYV